MAFKISFISDVREVVRGNEAMEKGFDQTVDSLDGMTRAAQKAGQRTGQELDGIGDDAQEVAKKLERKFRDALEDVADRSKRTGDALGDNVKRGTRQAEDGVKEFGDEAESTAKEAAASFDGSADSIAGAFQEVAANAFAGFGPAGAAAGLAAAAGIGVLWSSIQENAAATKQRVEDMFSDMVESGASALSDQFINDQLAKIYSGADDAAVKLSDLRQMAKDTGIDEAQLARAFAGDQDARVDALARVKKASEDAFQATFSMDQEQVDSATKRQAEVSRWIDDLEKLGDNYDSAANRVDGYTRAVEGVPGTVNTKINAETGEGVLKVEEFQRRAQSPLAASVVVTADTRELDRELAKPRTVRVGVMARPGQPAVI